MAGHTNKKVYNVHFAPISKNPAVFFCHPKDWLFALALPDQVPELRKLLVEYFFIGLYAKKLTDNLLKN